MKRLLNTEETGERLGKSSWWVRENIPRLGIPAIKVGRQWRVIEDELEEWLELHRATEVF